MKKKNVLIIAIVTLLLVIAAYLAYATTQKTNTPPVSHGSTEATYVSVTDQLRQKFGQSAVQPVEMDSIDPATESLGSKQRVTVASEHVDIWEYSSSSETNSKAGFISTDGSEVGLQQIDWTASSHWYKKDKVIALYIGDNKEIVEALNDILGKQFAGQNF